jgi:hypothetical protein
MPRAISKCPGCGEPVTPFAAGCAICVTDLEAARAQLAAKRRVELPRTPELAGRFSEIDWIHVAVALVLALAAPPFGFLLALYWATQRYRAGERLMTGLMVGAAALAVAAFLAPVWFWSHIY